MSERFLRWIQRRIIWRLQRPLERADFAIALRYPDTDPEEATDE